jgi:hypothetical protein
VKCKVFEGNSGALEMATVHKMRPRTKHINIKYHHFRSFVENGSVVIQYIKLANNLADTLLRTHRLAIMGWDVYDEKGCENTIYEAANNLNHEQGDGYKSPPAGTDGNGKATTTSQNPSRGTTHMERAYSSLRGTIKTSIESPHTVAQRPHTVARTVKDNAAAFNS